MDDAGRVRGSTLHGLFDADRFRASLLDDLARRHERDVRPSDVPFDRRLDAQHDRLADWLDAHLDVDAVLGLIGEGAVAGAGPGW